MHANRPKKNRTMLQLAARLRAREAAGIVSSESLSHVIAQYIQRFDPKNGDLNVDFSEIFGVRRGAPIGNRNRVTHGRHTREVRDLNAAIRAHDEKGRSLISSAYDAFDRTPPRRL